MFKRIRRIFVKPIIKMVHDELEYQNSAVKEYRKLAQEAVDEKMKDYYSKEASKYEQRCKEAYDIWATICRNYY